VHVHRCGCGPRTCTTMHAMDRRPGVEGAGTWLTHHTHNLSLFLAHTHSLARRSNHKGVRIPLAAVETTVIGYCARAHGEKEGTLTALVSMAAPHLGRSILARLSAQKKSKLLDESVRLWNGSGLNSFTLMYTGMFTSRIRARIRAYTSSNVAFSSSHSGGISHTHTHTHTHTHAHAQSVVLIGTVFDAQVTRHHLGEQLPLHPPYCISP
jgi:hypothetical protein